MQVGLPRQPRKPRSDISGRVRGNAVRRVRLGGTAEEISSRRIRYQGGASVPQPHLRADPARGRSDRHSVRESPFMERRVPRGIERL